MADRHYQLVIQKGPQPGQVYPLSSTSVIVGRDPMADIVINDPEVSRQHARLRRTEFGYQIQDLGSTNSTFVDGERLGAEAVNLVSGQLVTMGSGIVLLYQMVGEEGEDDLPGPVTMVGGPRIERGRAGERAPYEYEAGDFELEDERRRREPEVRYRSAEPLPDYKSPPTAAERERRRRNSIIAAVIILVLCCCCAFPLSGWYIWGDPLLEFLQSLGFF